MSYVDLVICETSTGRTELFQAPKFSLLKPDDEVIVDQKGQDVKLKVKDVINMSTQSDEYRFITELFCVVEPRKLVGKVTFEKFEYKESEEDDQR